MTVSACESAGDIAAHLSECVHTQPPPVIVKTKRPVKRREKKSHSGRDVSAGEQKEAALTVAKDETEIGMTHTKSSVKHLRVVLPHNVPMLVLSNESGKNNEGHKNRGEIENGVDQNLQCPAEFSACTPTKCKQSMYLDMTDDTDDEDYSITTSRCSEVAATPKSSCDEAQTELEVPHVTPKLIYPSSLPSKPEVRRKVRNKNPTSNIHRTQCDVNGLCTRRSSRLPPVSLEGGRGVIQGLTVDTNVSEASTAKSNAKWYRSYGALRTEKRVVRSRYRFKGSRAGDGDDSPARNKMLLYNSRSYQVKSYCKFLSPREETREMNNDSPMETKCALPWLKLSSESSNKKRFRRGSRVSAETNAQVMPPFLPSIAQPLTCKQ